MHAATLWARVNGHVWYTYGASTTAGRDLRPSNAIQWQMLRDAAAEGAQTYDMRGITDTLDPEDPPVRAAAVQAGHRGLRTGVFRRVGLSHPPGPEPRLRGIHAPPLIVRAVSVAATLAR